jgi:hypothetical protein
LLREISLPLFFPAIAAVLTYFYKPEYFLILSLTISAEVYERELKQSLSSSARWNKLRASSCTDSIRLAIHLVKTPNTSSQNPFTAGYVVDIAQGESIQPSPQTPLNHRGYWKRLSGTCCKLR